MELEVGSVVEGKVKTLTKFGAFVELDGEKTGMVHISEVASTYVKEITDYVSEGQEVKVKILSIDENGKISLSMKQVPGAVDKPQPREKNFKKRDRGTPNVWNGPKQTQLDSSDMSFEEMMSKWKSSSEEKMADLKRSSDSKHGGGGGYGRRGGAHRP